MVLNDAFFVPYFRKSFNKFIRMLFVFKQVLFLMVDCKEYSFLVKEDVQILHGDNFGGQSNFDQMRIQVFTNKN